MARALFKTTLLSAVLVRRVLGVFCIVGRSVAESDAGSSRAQVALLLAAAPARGASAPNYIVCAQGLNHCCCNLVGGGPLTRVEAHPGPVKAEPGTSQFLDGNNQRYTCFQSSCQSNCANKFGPGCT